MKLILKEKYTKQVPTIYLNFEGGDYAHMTFNEVQRDNYTWWNVIITSSWGKWSYSWNRSGMGTDIYSFMSDNRHGYLKSKFTSQERELFSLEGTQKKLRKQLADNRPNYWSEKEEIDNLRVLIKELDAENDNDFTNQFLASEELVQEFGSEPWRFSVHKESERTAFFFNKVFPKFMPEIKRLANEYNYRNTKISA